MTTAIIAYTLAPPDKKRSLPKRQILYDIIDLTGTLIYYAGVKRKIAGRVKGFILQFLECMNL